MPRGHLPPTRRITAHCPRKALPRAFAAQRKEIHFPFLHAQHALWAQLPNTSGIIEYYTIFVMPIDHAGHLAFQGGSRFAMGLWMEQERHR